MKFKELTKKEVFKFVSYKQYKSILKGTAKDSTTFNLYMGIIETYKIHPCEMTLKDFYK